MNRPSDELMSLTLDELIDRGFVSRVRQPDGTIVYVAPELTDELWRVPCGLTLEPCVAVELRPWPSRQAELEAENDEMRQLLLVARWLVADIPAGDELADNLMARVTALPIPGGRFEPRDVDRATGRTGGVA